MGHPSDSSGLRIMHSVIVNMYRHSQDVERHVCRHDEKDAVLAISAIIVEIVDRTSLGPGAIDLEINAGHLALILAFGQNDALSKLPIIDVSVIEQSVDECLIVES